MFHSSLSVLLQWEPPKLNAPLVHLIWVPAVRHSVSCWRTLPLCTQPLLPTTPATPGWLLQASDSLSSCSSSLSKSLQSLKHLSFSKLPCSSLPRAFIQLAMLLQTLSLMSLMSALYNLDLMSAWISPSKRLSQIIISSMSDSSHQVLFWMSATYSFST